MLALAPVMVPAIAPDPVTLSFAFFGCNRLGAKEWDPAANPSSANLPQLRRTLADVSALRPRPFALFAGGDLVNNYADDSGATLEAQLDGWAPEIARCAVPVVPLPGNHELNRKIGGQRLPADATYGVWKTWFVAHPGLRLYGNGPVPKSSPEDRLTFDESKMSYSFDRGGVRFIVLNTDSRTSAPDATTGTKLGWTPAHWASARIAEADRDPTVRSVVLMGHRNLIAPATCEGDAPIAPEPGAVLLKAIRGSAKARAYVCAHVHAWDVAPMTQDERGRKLQIVAGDGGSELEKGWRPKTGRTFGFVQILVHASGPPRLPPLAPPGPRALRRPGSGPALGGRPRDAHLTVD